MSVCLPCIYAYNRGTNYCPACGMKVPDKNCSGCKYYKPTTGWCDGQFINGPKFKCLNYSKWER